ncbi:MAG: protease modulator HflC [Methylotenera sp.]|jgi:membrane protease subunit HflC|uniref:Protein HflC n=1 Tax=Methylotenera mobilis TaxID=359408 RepID=A0A351R9P2_9PROT|nr:MULTISPECIES: protease modulator HflC [Methylotenera]HBA08763.1 protease modulator HflC [Methylotenera mobilis]MDP3211828.1 protease modulator HflC [Methylotenera sp.]PPC96271.1 MAG: protease modulator HflC [Methylotenera sp.]PPD02078.1 MAG: protease modulator HflC [Methylotenera sp.]PPD47077.1 MAG: protease modulator HflC [Methylotenera sp.]
MNKAKNIIILVVVGLMLLSTSAFTVNQTQYVIVQRLGEIVSVNKEPGLYFKVPFVDNLKYFDNRILTLDWEQPAKFITSENKYMMVDSFVKWRIVDPVKYYVSIKEGGEAAAEDRLSKVVNAVLRTEFGKRTVRDVIAGERGAVMDNLRKTADAEARQMGIAVVDVRLKRVDYAEEISKSVFDRMIAERKRLANQLRSEGAAASEKIRADADKQREVIIAEAYREAQKTKGEGDAKAGEIYNQSYSRNPEFYAFYRSQEAYKNSFKSKSDVMVLDPNSDFFKYMRSPNRK